MSSHPPCGYQDRSDPEKVYGWPFCHLLDLWPSAAQCNACAARDPNARYTFPGRVPPLPDGEEARAGVVIGHFRQPEIVRLNVASIRRRCGASVPILISDDCSGPWDAPFESRHPWLLHKIALDFPNVHIWPSHERIGHAGGDMAAFWKGLIWARAQGMHVLVKLSQRHIIERDNWLQEIAEELCRAGYPLAGKPDARFRYAIRTEAVALRVEAWTRPEVLTSLTPRPIDQAMEHYLERINERKLGGRILPWRILADRRDLKAEGVYFREANSEAEYRELAASYGMTLSDEFSTLDSNQMADYVKG